MNTRIKYSSIGLEDYGMQTTDYFYEFARFARRYNVKTKKALIYSLETYINLYFGMLGQVTREQIFDNNAWNSTKTDDEYFKALENNKIGDLKHKGAAQCTERAAVAQQILNLFGAESYYCMGCIDLGDRQEAHCFNIFRKQNKYAVLDYSCPVKGYAADGREIVLYPFIGDLSDEEFAEFTQKGTIKAFKKHKYVDGKRIETPGERMYVVGSFEIKKPKDVATVIIDI